MKHTFLTTSLILLLAVCMHSCKKFVEIDPPKTEIVLTEAFKEDNSATSAVLGIYINMLSNFNFENSGITVFGGLAADELSDFYQNAESMQFQENKLDPNNSTISSMWTAAYKNIVLINTCIEGLEKSTTLSDAVKAQLLGECRFTRAFVNFYLVNLWDHVPLVTATNWRVNGKIGQTGKDSVYAAIIEDLKTAQAQLKEEYPTAERVRPNKWAATALLARAYLFRKDYVNAEAQASTVIGSGAYTPLPALNDAFLKESKEAIWQLMPSRNLVLATQEGYVFIGDVPSGYAPNYTLNAALLNSFETGDARKTAWVNSVDYQGTVYYYPFKYKERGDYFATDVPEYYIMLRLSEQYLIRAEARAWQDKLDDAEDDLNEIRNRAGLVDVSGLDKNGLISAIERENRHEFFAEWGHRWLDLKRTGRADAVLAPQKPGWVSTAVNFPIPQSERELNKKLIQNTGYKP